MSLMLKQSLTISQTLIFSTAKTQTLRACSFHNFEQRRCHLDHNKNNKMEGHSPLLDIRIPNDGKMSDCSFGHVEV